MPSSGRARLIERRTLGVLGFRGLVVDELFDQALKIGLQMA